MKMIRNLNKMGTCLSLIVFVFGCVNAWAVVLYPLSPEIENADKVQAEKREIIKRIENLKTQDVKFVKEAGNELKQMEEGDIDAHPKNEPCEERH